MRTPTPLPEELADQAFSIARARRAGVSRSRLARGDLAVPFSGVRVPRGDDAVLEPAQLDRRHPAYWKRLGELSSARVAAFSERMPRELAFSHLSAARIHGLFVPTRLAADMTVHVTTTSATRRPRLAGVRAHRARARSFRVCEVDGLNVMTPLDTWLSLSTVFRLDELVMMGDQLVRRNTPPATLALLEEGVARHSGRHGITLLRAALPLIRLRTDSVKETELRLLIVRAGLPEPEINVSIANRHGAHIRMCDLVYPRYRIAIEYDGGQHRADEKQFLKDIDRLDEAMEEDWRVIRVHKDHLRLGGPVIVRRIETALRSRGWRP